VIKTNFDKLLHTMVEYLDAEKLERGKIVYRHDQAADASLALRNAVVLFREFARQKNIKIDAMVADGISFAIDPDALDRVVNNLLENAVRFTGTGGKIEVCLRRTSRAIELGVKDSGIGLTADQQEHIFEPYFQAVQPDGPSAGIGMGLSIVKKIIDAVGAEIKVESRPGKGTSFTCFFGLNRPAAGAATDHKRKAIRHRAVPAQTAFREDRSNVLFVEDNLELLAYLVEQTERLFNVYAAKNGSEALAMLKVIPKPHLIISDILMDSMGGYRFFEEVMKDGQAKDIPFIFLSAVNSQKERIEGLRNGAVDYIPKPFSIDELIAKMESILKVQEALKEKNIVLLGSKMYHILDQLARDGHGSSPDDTAESSNRLFFDYGISRKEIEVISLLRLGLEHKEIASRLVISTNTVRTYIARIYKKCRVNNKIELFARLKTL
jgi:DNA-binding NarL/FixJ family response regulator/anti-sigma regulatory factor (Ser/Thr protein kinase)